MNTTTTKGGPVTRRSYEIMNSDDFEDRVARLQREASEAGEAELAATCDTALDDPGYSSEQSDWARWTAARRRCAYALAHAEAQS